MSRIVVTGGTGALGRVLVPQLSSRDHEVFVLSRSKAKASAYGMIPRVFVEECDVSRPGPWQATFARADVVIHLAAPSLFDPAATASPAAQQQMIATRAKIMREVAKAVQSATPAPKLLLVASSTAIYGERLDVVDETAPFGTGFLPSLFASVESEAAIVRSKTRLVALRFAHILSPTARLLTAKSSTSLPEASNWPFSFVHAADAASLVVRVATSSLDGCVNVAAPASSVVALHRALGVTTPPQPSGLAKLFGKKGPASSAQPELVVSLQAVRSRYAQSLDFYPTHTTLDGAIKACRASS